MRHIIGHQFLPSNSSYKLSTHHIFCFSAISKSSKSSHKKAQTSQQEVQPETTAINSLFNEITQIFGSDGIVRDKIPSGILISKGNNWANALLNEELKICKQVACRNAELSNRLQEKKTQMRDSHENDISSIVREITGIIRSENGAVSMEERLESVGFRYDTEVVDKVLKRCFKVPHLAYRFFNWVKMKDGFCHNTSTYNSMLCIAGQAKELKAVDDLVEDMEKNSCEKDIKTWTILISLFGKAKLMGKALFFFEKMKKSGFEPDEKIYRTMLHSLCIAGKGEIAMELYKEMAQRDLRLDLSLYKILLGTMAKSGDIGTVNSVADDMIRLSELPERNVYVSKLRSFCVAGRIKEALELIRELKNKDIPLDHEYFETLVKGLCRADRVADAVELVQIMKRGNFADAKVYGIIINGYLRRKELSKALELFQSMKEAGYQPTTSTYTELMQHLFDLDQYQKGIQLYNEMLERGIEADNVAVMAVVAGHLRQNHMSEAWEVLNDMEDKGIKPTWKSYSIFIKELCKILRTDEILKVLEKMRASKIVIGDKIFQWVIACMEKSGETDNVQKVKQMQKISGFYPVRDEVLRQPGLQVEKNHCQSEQGRIDCELVRPLSKGYSEEDLQEICQILSSPEDWGIIQEALGKCKVQFTPELVLEVLSNCSIHGNASLHFFSWVGMQSAYRHTTETYNMAMKISGRGKDFKHMRSLFYEMKSKGLLVTPDTWAIMIMQYGRTGLTEIALKIFNDMKDKQYKPTESIYKSLIINLCGRKGRKVDEAMKLFHEMIRAGHIPDREMVEAYLCCLCETGRLSEARKSVNSLCKIGYTVPLSYTLHIRALCRAGRLEEALSLLDEVGAERSALDIYTYASIVHGLLRKGREEEALAKVDSMKRAGINPNVHVYTSLMVHFFKEKQIGKAMGILEKMQHEGYEPTVVTYSTLIRGYMNMGRASDAWNVFRDMKLKGPAPDFKTYSMFISCLCKAGKSEESLQLIYEMLNNGIVPSTINFRTVFYGLNREGKHDLAQCVLQQKFAIRSKRKFLT